LEELGVNAINPKAWLIQFSPKIFGEKFSGVISLATITVSVMVLNLQCIKQCIRGIVINLHLNLGP
jgi:hypothetical protein